MPITSAAKELFHQFMSPYRLGKRASVNTTSDCSGQYLPHNSFLVVGPDDSGCVKARKFSILCRISVKAVSRTSSGTGPQTERVRTKHRNERLPLASRKPIPCRIQDLFFSRAPRHPPLPSPFLGFSFCDVVGAYQRGILHQLTAAANCTFFMGQAADRSGDFGAATSQTPLLGGGHRSALISDQFVHYLSS